MALSLRSRRSRLIDGGLVLLFALLSSLVVLRTGLRAANSTSGVAVVYAPWTGPETAILRATSAGASLVRVGALPWIVIVAPQDDGYVERVLKDGALAAVDPNVLADCAPGLLTERLKAQ